MKAKTRLELVQRMLARMPESDQKAEHVREWAEILALPQNVVSADAPDQAAEKHRVATATVMPTRLH
jgi:hypothetical protein